MTAPLRARARRLRGATLTELMVTVGIASIVIAAATMAATSMFSMTQGQARQSSAEAQLALAMSSLDRLLSSTGTGFANARYSFRVRNNVPAGTLAGDSSGMNVVTAGASGAGIIAGTDVIEVGWGNPVFRRAGTVVGSVCSSSCTVQLQNADPLADQEWGTLDADGGSTGSVISGLPYLLFTRDQNPRESCLGKITGIVSPTNRTLTVQMLNDNYGTTTPDCTVNNNGDLLVYKLEERRRIIVYQRANGADLGLYVQKADPSTGAFTTDPDALALGVDNLQVGPLVGAEFDGGVAAVGSCSAVDGGVCNCGVNPGVCALGEQGGIATASPTGLNSLVRGALIQVAVRGERRAGARAPVSLDTDGGAVDDIRRAQGELTFNLLNGYLAVQ